MITSTVLFRLKQIYMQEQEVNDEIIALNYCILPPCNNEKVRMIDPDFPRVNQLVHLIQVKSDPMHLAC